MNDKIRALAEKLLKTGYDDLPARERRILQRLAERVHISADMNTAYDLQRTFGQRAADRIALFGGSWTFLGLFAAALLGWAAINSEWLAGLGLRFDPFPFPFIFLNLLLSMLAAIQAPVIMMSQNRQSARDRMAAEHDYEVNLKAELEIMQLHEKLDDLRQMQWRDLLLLQREQLAALEGIKSGLAEKS